ncbi:MAG: hypothetical protein JSU87_12145 [Gemmatimonadota bacterium]|nr:MAG: hypothetical protein JSU87_12145 [Gemmatimonadota bacterium]
MNAEKITLRPLASQDDYRRCVALQRATWGEDFGECVPPSILLAAQKVGGVAAGAFDLEGRLLGFIFGVSGVRAGRPAHWSDMLAVAEGARGHRLGIRLKAYQRELLLKNGIEVAYWTYDPLEAQNAHININLLGARPIEYVPDMYGEATGSSLHAGLPTDRFVVEWLLTDPAVEAALAGEKLAQAAATEAAGVNMQTSGGARLSHEPELPADPAVRVEVPWDVQSLKRTSMEVARSWREETRRAFLYYLENGYAVTAFLRDAAGRRCFYVLTRR